VHTIAKITPADYPDLLAAVDAGIPQRELARRYGCAPSLVARHVARAKRAREPSDRRQEPDLGLTAEPHNGSMREILEARIRDPRTSARDLASLTNTLARLKEEEKPASGPSIYDLRRGTLILEPGPAGPDRRYRRYRLMMRVRGGIDHFSGNDYDLTAAGALYLLVCALGSAFGLTPEDILGAPTTPGQ
jgi:hypothetical protein